MAHTWQPNEPAATGGATDFAPRDHASSQPPGDCLTILEGDWISLRRGNATDLLRPTWIISAHSAGKGTLLVAECDQYTVRAPLHAVVAKLERFGLVRIHRSMAINVARIRRSISGGQHRFRVVLDTGLEIEVGRSFQRDFRARLGARTHRKSPLRFLTPTPGAAQA